MTNKRKPLSYYSWNVSEELYRKDEALSYSIISKFNREGFSKLDELFNKVESPSLTFGSVVDTILTEGIEEFKNKFIVFSNTNVSDSISTIVRTLFSRYSDFYKRIEDIPKDIISEVCVEHNYYANEKYINYRVKTVIEQGSSLFDFLYIAQDKKVITKDIEEDALLCCNVLKSSITGKYFNPPDNEDIELFYQLKFKASFEGIPLRCMFDIIEINHKNKTIQPIDLKTSYKKEYDFYKSFLDWSYYIQAQLYYYILSQSIKDIDEYKDYTILDYKFIVINRTSLTPLVWIYRDTKAEVDCLYGKNKNIICKNWRNIVKELDFYLKTKPQVPNGIKEENDIINFLNEI